MFERDCDELTNWYNKMSAVMSAEEKAKDVSSAESLIERHSEHKSELESRDDSLSKTLKNGQELLVLSQEAADSPLVENRQTISDRLEHLTSERERLRQAVQSKQAFFLQSLEIIQKRDNLKELMALVQQKTDQRRILLQVCFRIFYLL